MSRLGDQPDRDRGQARLRLDPLSEGHLVAGRERDLLARGEPAGGNVDRGRAPALEGVGQFHRLLEGPAALDPVGGRDAHPDRLARRDRLAHRLEAFQRKPHPVGERAAVLVGALVGERRQELVQQVAVRPVQLEPVDAEGQRPPRRGDEAVADPLQALGIEGVGCRLALPVREGGGCLRAPAVGSLGVDLGAAVPGDAARGLAARMVDLDRDRHRRVAAHRVEDAAERTLGLVGIEPEIAGRDPGFRRDRCRLQGEEARPRHRHLRQMHELPVTRLAGMGRVLAHRGDDDAVLEGEVVEAQGLEQAGVHAMRDSGVAMLRA